MPTKENQPASVNLLTQLVGYNQSAWMQLTVGLTLSALVLISVSMAVRGLPIRPYKEQGLWIIAFLLSAWFFTKPALEAVVKNLQRLTDTADVEATLAQFSTPRHQRIGWAIYAIGAVLGFLEHFRFLFLEDTPLLHHVLYFILGMLVFTVIAGYLHTTFTSVRLITNLVKKTRPSNVYDPTPFKPVAQWSLVISLTIIGVLTLSVLGSGELRADPVQWGVRIFFLIFAGVSFFAAMWSTHKVMAQNKQKEIARINTVLAELHQELMQALAQRQLDEVKSLANLSDTLNTHRTSLEAIQDWPYTTRNIRSLIGSAVIPIAISIIKAFID
ncbi:MAG: hypothetical protein H8E28_12405 [Anaerolineae bacterium]|nr:hypothetical protein [Anaerolineae bacterium]